MEECDMRILQVKKDSFEFRRDIQIGGENPRTGKIAAEKIIRYFEEKQRSKVSRAATFLRLGQRRCAVRHPPPGTAA